MQGGGEDGKNGCEGMAQQSELVEGGRMMGGIFCFQALGGGVFTRREPLLGLSGPLILVMV